MASGRRLLSLAPILTRRSWEDVAPELERFLRRLWDSEGNGIPAGFNSLLPTTITPSASGTAGTGNTVGWAAADHSHPASTGVASGLENANAEGSSTKFPRLDHKHKRDVRVQKADVDVGTRNALNFEGSPDIAVSVVDEPGGDKVTVSTALTASAAIQLSHHPHTHNIVDVIGASAGGSGDPMMPMAPRPHTHDAVDLYNVVSVENSGVAGTNLSLGDFILASQIFGG